MREITTGRTGKWLDAAGAAAAWLCAIHCLVLPFFITLLPLVGLSFLLEESTERFFIGISATLAIFSLLPAYFRQHGKLRTILLACAGIGLVIFTHFIFEENLTAKFVLLLAGAVLISAAHFINRRLCRSCSIC